MLLGVLCILSIASGANVDAMTKLNDCPAFTAQDKMNSGYLVGDGTNGLATGKQYHYLMVQS